MITVSNLTKKYGQKTVLDNVSFDVKEGEIVGFLGPNGAGKSTVMNIITGYISATEGSAQIDGHDIAKEPIEAKKRIGYLPEIPPLYVDMTVREYLEFVCELKKVKKADMKAHIDGIIETVKISDVENRRIGNLSKGYRQRVGLAGALIGDPPVIILDEPTVGLDPKQIVEMRNVIKSLGETKTVILSSHILSEISAVADRVIIINRGKIVTEDTPENLQKRLGKSHRVLLTVSGDREKAEQLLKSFDGVSGVVCTSSNGDEHSFEFETLLGANDRKKLFFAFAKENLAIMSQREKKLTLEEIFLSVTGSDGKGSDGVEGDI